MEKRVANENLFASERQCLNPFGGDGGCVFCQNFFVLRVGRNPFGHAASCTAIHDDGDRYMLGQSLQKFSFHFPQSAIGNDKQAVIYAVEDAECRVCIRAVGVKTGRVHYVAQIENFGGLFRLQAEKTFVGIHVAQGGQVAKLLRRYVCQTTVSPPILKFFVTVAVSRRQ